MTSPSYLTFTKQTGNSKHLMIGGDIIPIICEKTGVSSDFLYFGTETFDIGILNDFTPAQIEMGLDVLKRLAEIVYTADGNELLIKEAMRRQSPTDI